MGFFTSKEDEDRMARLFCRVIDLEERVAKVEITPKHKIGGLIKGNKIVGIEKVIRSSHICKMYDPVFVRYTCYDKDKNDLVIVEQ